MHLRSIGLYDSESCKDGVENQDEQPLKRKDFIDREEELEHRIINKIRESEQRILTSVVFSKSK
jgi:hypothetical protein